MEEVFIAPDKAPNIAIETPEWANGLELRGVYYEGYTDNLEQLLNKHSSSTITTYGVRRSHSCNHLVQSDNKENEEMQVRSTKMFKSYWY